jgi:hypothetical protein
MPLPLPARKITPVSVKQEAGFIPERGVDIFKEKNLHMPGFEPQTVQPIT